jgi:AcrR family transcriptional regulator
MKSASTQKTSRREEARALFRNAILEAAEEIFAERSFHAARIQDIAARARVGVGTVYNHFEQKEDVFRALIDERTEAMLATLAPSPADPHSFEEALLARVTRFLEYVEQHRGLFQIVMSFGVSPNVADESAKELCGKSVKRIERMRAAWREIVREGIAAGVLEGQDPDDLAVFLGGTVRSITFRELMRNEPLAPRASVITSLFLGGARKKAVS